MRDHLATVQAESSHTLIVKHIDGYTPRTVLKKLKEGSVRVHNFKIIANATRSQYEHHVVGEYTVNEAACVASHIKAIFQAWKDRVRFALVIEDDVRLDARVFREVDVFKRHSPVKWEAMQLYTNNQDVLKTFLRMKYRTPVPWMPEHWSAGATLYTREGLRKLVFELVSENGVYELGKRRSFVADEILYLLTQSVSYFSRHVRVEQFSSTVQSADLLDNQVQITSNIERLLAADPETNTAVPSTCPWESLAVHLLSFVPSEKRQSYISLRTLRENVQFVRDLCQNAKIHVNVRVVAHKRQKRVEKELRRLSFASHINLYTGSDDFVSLHQGTSDVDKILLVGTGIRLSTLPIQEFARMSRTAAVAGALKQSKETTIFDINKDAAKFRGYDDGSFWKRIDLPSNALEFQHIPSHVTLLDGDFVRWYLEKWKRFFTSSCVNNHESRMNVPLASFEYSWCGAARIWRGDKVNKLSDILTPCRLILLTVDRQDLGTMDHMERKTIAERYHSARSVPEDCTWPQQLLWQQETINFVEKFGDYAEPIGDFERMIRSPRTGLMVVRISDDQARCAPGLSPGLEWCVKPVRDEKNVACSLSWDEMLSLVGSKIRKQLLANSYWSDVFLRNGILGELPSTEMQGIYKAHIAAHKSLCKEAVKTGMQYGIVLEDDVELNSLLTQELLISLARTSPEVSVFNLSPSTDICKRFGALLEKECFRHHDLETWGAGFVLYDLRKTCMQGFMDAQEQLMACVPSDVGIYSGTNGHLAVDVVIPYGKYLQTRHQTHSSDAIHQNLLQLQNHTDFLQLLLTEIHHTCVEKHSNTTFSEQLISSTLNGAFYALGCSSKSLK